MSQNINLHTEPVFGVVDLQHAKLQNVVKLVLGRGLHLKS